VTKKNLGHPVGYCVKRDGKGAFCDELPASGFHETAGKMRHCAGTEFFAVITKKKGGTLNRKEKSSSPMQGMASTIGGDQEC